MIQTVEMIENHCGCIWGMYKYNIALKSYSHDAMTFRCGGVLLASKWNLNLLSVLDGFISMLVRV